MTQLGQKTKVSISVLGSALGAAPITLGAVYCTEKFLPSQMSWLKRWFSKHIVEPNFPIFETLGRGLEKAHQNYDEKKREERVQAGEPVEEVQKPRTVAERSRDIADAIITSFLATGFDFVATYGLQKWFDKKLGINSHPGKVAFIDSTTTLVGIALMPTLFARFSENMRHGVRKLIQNITGMDRKRADALAITETYAVFPSVLSTGLGLGAAHFFARK